MAERRSTAQQKYDPVRGVALAALERIERGSQVDEAVRRAAAGQTLRPLDMRFILQMVNGSTKMKRRLDSEIRRFLTKPFAQLPPRLHVVLRLGFYQLLFMDRVPEAAAVSESVNLARRYCSDKLAGMVNAVMRTRLREPGRIRFPNPQSDPVQYLGDFYSYPDYFVSYCIDEFGYDRTVKLLERYNQPPHVTYRVNSLKAKPDEVAHLLQDEGVEFSYGRYLPEFIHIEQGGLPMEAELLTMGKVFVQDESAGLPVRLLNPRPGNSIIDLTAAPGGKATYAATRMRNQGRVTACDKSRERLKLLVDNAKRLGITIIAPVASDVFDFEGEPFDRVLLDPPCSGWGTAQKNADLRWSKSREDINNLCKVQRAMIDRAARLVKPGGILVYSTCTIIRRENDQIIEEFLLRHKDFEIETAAGYFDKEIVNERGYVKTYPDIEGFDGAFCARLRRRIT
jgi:16S rRNA (cytosine967-C5)-methyltransferase